MNKYILTAVAGVAGVLCSCSDFVDIKTQGGIVPDKIENFRYLLNNTNELIAGSGLPDIMSDDVEVVDGGRQYSSAIGGGEYYAWFGYAYSWSDVIYPATGNYKVDPAWNGMYNTSVYANVVLNEIDRCTNGTPEEKAALKAEALVHRADAYLMLVNQYAPQYRKATAATTPGVPLITSQSTTQEIKRASVQAVYDQIIKDLNDALPNLPKTQPFTTLPTKGAAYAELARAYLLMGEYKLAYDNAELALKENSTVVDLNAGQYPQLISASEIYLYKKPAQSNATYGCSMLRLSNEIVTLLGDKDLRFTTWTKPVATAASSISADGGYMFYQDIVLGGRNVGPSVPEMMLIKAEYFARNNNAVEAMKCINALRKYRFASGDYTELTASTADEALKVVIDERHREFFCKNLRWYDQRRLADDKRFAKTYTRSWGGKTITAEVDGRGFVVPIPPYQKVLAPNM